MALAVGDAAGIQRGSSVLDIGCGMGDSLLLWKRQYGCREVIGVNITESECTAARQLVDGSCKVAHEDGIEYLKYTSDKVDVVVSVDALYHVDTRRAFLQQVPIVLVDSSSGCFGAVDMFGSQDLMDINGDVPGFWALFRKSPTSCILLHFLSLSAGIPIENLLYRSNQLANLKSVSFMNRQVVTEKVFLPFSSYMFKQAAVEWKARKFYKFLYLSGAASFMHFVSITGLVEVVVYAVKFHN